MNWKTDLKKLSRMQKRDQKRKSESELKRHGRHNKKV